MKAVSDQRSAKNSELRTLNSQLVFIHGWATDSNVWKYQLEEFSKGYEVVAIDLPGHGEKDIWSEPTLMPAVEKVLRIAHHASHINPSMPPFHKGGSRGIIGIGWSLGGQAILEAAVENPDALKAIVLIGVSPKFVADETFPYGQPRGVAKRMLKDIKKGFNKTLERFYPLNFTQEELATDNAEWFLGHYKKKSAVFNHDSIAKGLETLLSLDLRDAISSIKIPVLLIHGEKDNICPLEAGKYLAENLPNAKLAIVKEVGHAPFLTRHKEFNELVQEFLDSTIKLPFLSRSGQRGGRYL